MNSDSKQHTRPGCQCVLQMPDIRLLAAWACSPPELSRVQLLQVHQAEGDAQEQLPEGFTEGEVERDGAQLLVTRVVLDSGSVHQLDVNK
jgi:hypothetical protein